MIETYLRSWLLDDIAIRSGGDGRTVEAYAAIFDTPVEVRDQQGHYMEVINRTAFDRTLHNNAVDRVQVLYNHGLTTYGTPDMLGSVPIGRALEIRADQKGLFTVTRYNQSNLADAVLESIRNGDIRAQSFRGKIYKSNPMKVPRAKGGELPRITRAELGLSDYGPTPSPVYAGAEITMVRSAQEIASDITKLANEEIADLVRTLSSFTPPVDSEDNESATAGNAALGTEDSREAHSARNRLFRLKAEMRLRGM